MRKDHSALYQRVTDLEQKHGRRPWFRGFGYRLSEHVQGDAAVAEMERQQAEDEKNRDIRFVLSTPGIKRDGSEIMQEGWHLDPYVRSGSPVMWAHSRGRAMAPASDGDVLPVGNGREMGLTKIPHWGMSLTGTCRFWTEELNAFAERVYQIYRQDLMRSVSVAWATLKAEWIQDEAGYYVGIRFLEQDLCEFSMVPVPADPDATARCVRDFGLSAKDLTMVQSLVDPEGVPIITLDPERPQPERLPVRSYLDLKRAEPKAVADAKDTKDTKIDPPPAPTGDRAAIPYAVHGDCPKADKAMRWSGSAAKKRLAKWASSDGSGKKEKMEWDKYERGHVYVDRDAADQFGSYKGPHHDVVDGTFKVVFRGVSACAQRLQQNAFDVPEGDKPGMRTHIGQHYAQFDETPPWDRAAGRMYEQTMAALADEALSTAERAALQETAVRLATELYGSERLREAWESRAAGAADGSAWPSIVRAVETHLAAFADADERDEHIDGVLDELRTIVERGDTAYGLVQELFRLVDVDDGEALLVKVRALIAEPQSTAVALPDPERLTSLLRDIDADVARLKPATPKDVKRDDKIVKDDSPSGDSLFEDIMRSVKKDGRAATV